MSRILALSTFSRPDPLRRLDALEGRLKRGLVVVKKPKFAPFPEDKPSRLL